MIATLEYVEIIDRSEALGKMILQSDVMKAYRNARNELEQNKESQRLIKAFADIKDHYEDVQRFGTYHPDYHEIMRSVRRVKRNMDMNHQVAKFKVAERNLQRLLDEVCQYIASHVSVQIKAPKDGAALTDGGCSSGGCGSGGTCSCKAS